MCGRRAQQGTDTRAVLLRDGNPDELGEVAGGVRDDRFELAADDVSLIAIRARRRQVDVETFAADQAPHFVGGLRQVAERLLGERADQELNGFHDGARHLPAFIHVVVEDVDRTDCRDASERAQRFANDVRRQVRPDALGDRHRLHIVLPFGNRRGQDLLDRLESEVDTGETVIARRVRPVDVPSGNAFPQLRVRLIDFDEQHVRVCSRQLHAEDVVAAAKYDDLAGEALLDGVDDFIVDDALPKGSVNRGGDDRRVLAHQAQHLQNGAGNGHAAIRQQDHRLTELGPDGRPGRIVSQDVAGQALRVRRQDRVDDRRRFRRMPPGHDRPGHHARRRALGLGLDRLRRRRLALHSLSPIKGPSPGRLLPQISHTRAVTHTKSTRAIIDPQPSIAALGTCPRAVLNREQAEPGGPGNSPPQRAAALRGLLPGPLQRSR